MLLVNRKLLETYEMCVVFVGLEDPCQPGVRTPTTHHHHHHRTLHQVSPPLTHQVAAPPTVRRPGSRLVYHTCRFSTSRTATVQHSRQVRIWPRFHVPSTSRVPSWTGKPGKMGRYFPVREKSGNFDQTGKVRENHIKHWKTEGISGKCYWLFLVMSK